MNDIVSKLAVGGSSSYAPTVVDSDKYTAVRQGRNKFFLTVAALSGVALTAYAVPNFIVRKHATALFRAHCSGKVLDLVPKVGDSASVGLYEASRTCRVEFLVDERVTDDGAYRIDETLTEEQQEARRKAMTLEYTARHDELWVTSPVTFAVAERREVMQRKVDEMYDTVVVRHELCNCDDAAVESLIGEGVRLLKPGGRLVVVEVGAGSLKWVNQFLHWYHTKLQTTLYLSRDYSKMPFAISGSLESIHDSRQLFGFHHAMAWKKH